MKSLWACIEGMVDLSLPFTATDSSDLAVTSRFGILVLFEARSLLLYVLVLPNSSTNVAIFLSCPMKIFWTYIEGMVGLSLPSSQRPTALIWLPGPDLDLALQHSWNAFTPPVCFGASQFFYACCNIVFMIHEEP